MCPYGLLFPYLTFNPGNFRKPSGLQGITVICFKFLYRILKFMDKNRKNPQALSGLFINSDMEKVSTRDSRGCGEYG